MDREGWYIEKYGFITIFSSDFHNLASTSNAIKFHSGFVSLDFGTVFVLIMPFILALSFLDLKINNFIRFSSGDFKSIKFFFDKGVFILFLSVSLFAGILVYFSLEKFSPTNFCILNRSEKLCARSDIVKATDCFQTGQFEHWFKMLIFSIFY